MVGLVWIKILPHTQNQRFGLRRACERHCSETGQELTVNDGYLAVSAFLTLFRVNRKLASPMNMMINP